MEVIHHELIPAKEGFVLKLYLDPSLAEFSRELFHQDETDESSFN